ncbi:hypothetical protein JCM6882_008995 [Rhodosporidiobolus microsporus]
MHPSHTSPTHKGGHQPHKGPAQSPRAASTLAGWDGRAPAREAASAGWNRQNGSSTAYGGSAGALSDSQSPSLGPTAANTFPPWVDPAFLDPTLPQPPPLSTSTNLQSAQPTPPGQHSTSFASHPMWDTTLHGSAMWSNEPAPSSSTWSVSLTAPAGGPPLHASQQPTPAPDSNAIPVPPPPLSDYGSSYASSYASSYPSLPPPPPPPPSSAYSVYHAPGPPPPYHPNGLTTAASNWPPPVPDSTSSLWPAAGPSSASTSYDPVLPHPTQGVASPASTIWPLLPPVPEGPGPAVEPSGATDFAPVAPASSAAKKGKTRARRSSRTAASVTTSVSSTDTGSSRSPQDATFAANSGGGSGRSTRSGGAGANGTASAPAGAAGAAVVDDEDDFYPLPPNAATASGKPKKPRRKRRKLGEPPRDLAQRKYVCELCIDQPKSFARPSALRIHMLTHTKEKPHVCPICFRSFAIISNLKRHQKLHEDENSALCTTKGGDAGFLAGAGEVDGGVGSGGGGV